MALLRRAVEQDPLSSNAYIGLGYAYRSIGRHEEAIEACRKALEISPQRISAHHLISILLADLGRDVEALAEAEQEPAGWTRLTSLAYVHAVAGRREASDDALRKLTVEHSAAIQIASVYSARGDLDEAFAWLDRAMEQRDPGVTHLISEPMFDRLHDDPRWRVLLRSAGFVD